MEATENATVRIALTGGVILVDKADEDRVRLVKWSLTRSRNGALYARNPSPKYGYLARWLVGNPKGMVVDHRNGNALDNRRCNLRVCTIQQNGWNRRKSRGSSKFKGIHLDSNPKMSSVRWRARIYCNGRGISLGSYSTTLEAALAYDAAAVRLFGEFAAPNFPERFAAKTGRT